MNFVEYNNVWLDDRTPLDVREVLWKCLNSGISVHILFGDPITGEVEPRAEGSGVLCLSDSEHPMLLLKLVSGKLIWLRCFKVLKIFNAEEGSLLYQAYQCKLPTLLTLSCKEITPWESGVEHRYVSWKSSSDAEASNDFDLSSWEEHLAKDEGIIPIPDSANTHRFCQYLLGYAHSY